MTGAIVALWLAKSHVKLLVTLSPVRLHIRGKRKIGPHGVVRYLICLALGLCLRSLQPVNTLVLHLGTPGLVEICTRTSLVLQPHSNLNHGTFLALQVAA
jgi:hypothetical protein